MADSPIRQPDSPEPDAPPARAECLDFLNRIPNDVPGETAKGALQKTHATGVVIALGWQDELICRATAGESASEVGAPINTGSGLTALSVSTGVMQSCMNTQLDTRADAQACRELGIGAIIVIPLFHRDHLLGLIEVISRRPYAFGMRDLQALRDMGEDFSEKLRLIAESANNRAVDKTDAAPGSSGILRRNADKIGMPRIGVSALAVVVCFLVGLCWGWKPVDPLANSVAGQVTLVSTIPVVPPQVSLPKPGEGTLVHRVDPAYPREALRRRIQGPVVLQARIGKDGFVFDARAIRGEPILSAAAVEAVRQWRFNPYMSHHQPLDSAAQVTFEFSLMK